MNRPEYDCIVVGGGLIGMLTARQLKLDGYSVLIIDQSTLGSESSWAGGGILSPLYPWRYADAISDLAVWGQQHYQQLAQDLARESGIDPQWLQSGLLILDSDEQQQAQDWARRYQVDMQVLDSAEIKQLEGGLGNAAKTALWMPQVAQLRNPRLVKACRESLLHLKVDIIEQREVIDILQEDQHVTGIRSKDGVIKAKRVIVNAGAWTAKLLEKADINVDVEPVRGQMLVFKAKPGILKHIVLVDGYYLIPRKDGRVLIGSTIEYVGFDKTTTSQAREHLYAKAVQLLPALADYEVEKHWSGLRPGSANGIPYIGTDPGLHGLYFNAGHFRNGVVLGLASVQICCDMIAGRTPIIDPAPFALGAKH